MFWPTISTRISSCRAALRSLAERIIGRLLIPGLARAASSTDLLLSNSTWVSRNGFSADMLGVPRNVEP